MIRKIQSYSVDSHSLGNRSAKRISELRESKSHAIDSSQMNRGADENSELAHHLHLLFPVCAASPWESPASSDLREAGNGELVRAEAGRAFGL